MRAKGAIMGIFSDLEMPEKDFQCKLTVLANEMLDEEDKVMLQKAMDNKLWSNHSLHNELTKRGFVIGYDTLRKHRAKVCLCAK